jgi:hypothetical protein
MVSGSDFLGRKFEDVLVRIFSGTTLIESSSRDVSSNSESIAWIWAFLEPMCRLTKELNIDQKGKIWLK